MLRGCLALMLLYAVAVVLEYRWADALPFGGTVAVVLGLGVTLSLASVQGLAQAWRLRDRPQTDVSRWQDGQCIRISGTLVPTGPVPRAPFSERPAIYCAYAGRSHDNEVGDASRQVAHWRGQWAVPCALQTASAALAVLGVPALREVPETQFRGRAYLPQAARHLANTDWQVTPELADLPRVASMMSEGLAGLPAHVINRAALGALGLRIGETSEAELLDRIDPDHWLFSERVVEPATQVTLVGTYRAHPPAIDINLAAATSDHALHLGDAGQVARRHWRSTLGFVAVLGGLTLAAHYAVYGDNGAWYRAALRGLGLGE
ncbi:MAG: hypothetical protein ACOZB0_09185 [Pseudomonadota bacterium]